MSTKVFPHTIVHKPAPPEPPREDPDWGLLLTLYVIASFVWDAAWQYIIGAFLHHG